MATEHFGIWRQRVHLVHRREHLGGCSLLELAAASDGDGVTSKGASVHVLEQGVFIVMSNLIWHSVLSTGGLTIEDSMSFSMTRRVETLNVYEFIKQLNSFTIQ